MIHTPDWHIMHGGFPGSNEGLWPPRRVQHVGEARLAIENLDRRDPPEYAPGGVPRGEAFNGNTLRLTPKPCLPAIPLRCTVAGVDLARTPILWRFVCRHVLVPA